MSSLWHVSMKNTFSKDKKKFRSYEKEGFMLLKRGQTGYTVGNR